MWLRCKRLLFYPIYLLIRQQEERERQAQLRGAPTMDPDIAATKIQKIWKGFSQRKKTKRMRDEELIFVGMVIE